MEIKKDWSTSWRMAPISICNFFLVVELASKWNQVKQELKVMWQIVNEVCKEVPFEA